MKRLLHLSACCALVLTALLVLTACMQQRGAAPTPADSGLVPDQASTGNPPLIPHEVAPSDGGKECLGCHKDGKNAPAMPDWHATLTDCRQCHVVEGEQIGEFKTQY